MHNINIKFLNKDLALGVKISLVLPFLIYKKKQFHLIMNDNAKKILSKKINLAATVFTKILALEMAILEHIVLLLVWIESQLFGLFID